MQDLNLKIHVSYILFGDGARALYCGLEFSFSGFGLLIGLLVFNIFALCAWAEAEDGFGPPLSRSIGRPRPEQ